MAEWDAYWIISQILNLLVFAVFFVTLFLIPSRDKVRKGEAGSNLFSGTIPVLIVIMYISLLIIPIMALLLVEKFIMVIATDGLLLIAVLLLTIDFVRTRKLYKEISDSNQVVQAAVAGYPAHEQVAQHQQAAPSGTMTVECPNCGGHIEIPQNSHQITCPYCGLSGTM
ncbi:MAG: zinc ribbon domain-containing protein [Thermoplasmatota archaeon]